MERALLADEHFVALTRIRYPNVSGLFTGEIGGILGVAVGKRCLDSRHICVARLQWDVKPSHNHLYLGVDLLKRLRKTSAKILGF